MEPEGILKAWTTKVRMSNAKMIAMRMASAYSRMTDFFLTLVLASTFASETVSLAGSFIDTSHSGRGEPH